MWGYRNDAQKEIQEKVTKNKKMKKNTTGTNDSIPKN